MTKLLSKTALAALPIAALLATAPAAAEIPDKNKDREGWIAASMAGTPASFCGPMAPKKRTGPADPDFMADQVAGQWDGVSPADADLDKAVYLANALCKFPGNPDLQAKLTPLWQAFVSFYGFGAADLADVAVLFDKDRKRTSLPSKGPADTRLSEVDGPIQLLVAKDHLVKSYNMSFMSYAEMLDITAKPSQHLLAAFVGECVDSYHGSIARWAICKADALALDRARLDAELAGPAIDPDARLTAKMKFVRLQQTVKAQAARFAAEAAKDSGVAKVVDEIPAAATKAWADDVAAHGPLVTWTHDQLDRAWSNNKKAFEGCEPVLLTHLTTLLTKVKPATAEALTDALRGNLGSQLAAAAEQCFVRNKAAQTYWSQQAWGRAAHRGVRTAIWHALTAAPIEFDTNRGADPLGLPAPVTLYANGTASSSAGTIAKLKDTGDAVEIAFKKETWKETVCKQWKETNRIDGISADGKLVYRTKCVKTAVETRSSTQEPVTVAKVYAAGLKVGVAASFVRNSDGSGYPVAVFGDKKRTKLVGAYGVMY